MCEARDEAGLTREELAVRAGMDRSYVSDVERGKASLSVDRLMRICRALGVRAAAVVERIDRRISRQPR